MAIARGAGLRAGDFAGARPVRPRSPLSRDAARSPPVGGRWSDVASGDARGRRFRVRVVLPSSRPIPADLAPSTAFVGGYPGEPLFRSADGGSTWAPAGPSRFISPHALAVSPVDPKDLYLSIAGDHTPSVRAPPSPPRSTRSTPPSTGAATEASRFSPKGSRERGPRPIPIQFVLFDPRDPATVWAGGDALYRKRGGGEWSKLPLPAREFRLAKGFGVVTAIAFDPRAGAVYTAVRGAGVYRSLDDGDSWVDVSGNLPTDHLPWEETRLRPAATGLALEPSTGRLFLSALTIDLDYRGLSAVRVPGGVYETSDGGTTWESVSEGLPAAGVDQMLLDARGAPTLFAVTTRGRAGASSGLFVRDLSAPLRLDAISPSTGSTDGGTLVLLSGDGFRPDSAVSVGGSPTTEFTFFSPQRIRVRTGAHPAGFEDVTVTNPDGARATLPAAFFYGSWSCDPSSTTLCLENGRFQVGVQGPDGAASAAAPLTVKSGFFWFDWNQNPQVVVKILDGRIRERSLLDPRLRPHGRRVHGPGDGQGERKDTRLREFRRPGRFDDRPQLVLTAAPQIRRSASDPGAAGRTTSGGRPGLRTRSRGRSSTPRRSRPSPARSGPSRRPPPHARSAPRRRRRRP